jgi:phytanoyl-CoA hydroxylase
MDDAKPPNDRAITADEIAQYRREGYLVLRGLLEAPHVASCLDALQDIADDRRPLASSKALLEPEVKAGRAQADQAIDRVRKFIEFTDDFPALRRAAMSRRLHAALDRILGEGRVMFQDMALVKPPRIGSEKRWHQDAAYFRVSDPGLIVGVWIALDPATRENGCMQLIPGSHLGGPVAHVPMLDINECHIRPDLVRAQDRIAVEMAPGDALIFHACLHHFTAPNTSGLRRRAIQFHYQQIGLVWGDLKLHTRAYHDERGEYCGCTVQPQPVPPGQEFEYRAGERLIPVAPED